MFWLLISLFFCWLIYREFTQPKVAMAGFSNFDRGYIVALFLLALLFAWRPFYYWYFEHTLSIAARNLSGSEAANVHCNTAFDAIFDNTLRVAGHANIETGDIVFQHPWCGRLIDYLEHPEQASDDEIWSLAILTHESMHVRGEYDEQKTECQAIQRNAYAGKLLGIPDTLADKNASYYYESLYKNRHSYFTPACAPGAAMDEQLSYSTWLSLLE
jgi:hypothetical protein